MVVVLQKGSSADRWFLGSLSGDSGQDNKWKVSAQGQQ